MTAPGSQPALKNSRALHLGSWAIVSATALLVTGATYLAWMVRETRTVEVVITELIWTFPFMLGTVVGWRIVVIAIGIAFAAALGLGWAHSGPSIWIEGVDNPYGIAGAFGGIAEGVVFIAVIVVFASTALSIIALLLRYRLYDIDLIIRRTLQYSVLTGLLSLVYLGGVGVLQAFVTAVGGQPSAIAAIARSETEIGSLSANLALTVQETLHPERVSLWLRKNTPLMPSRPPGEDR